MNTCEVCAGKGMVEAQMVDDDSSFLVDCPRCAGLGMTVFPLSGECS